MLLKICREYKKMTRDELCETLRRDSAVILPALAALCGDGTREFLLLVFAACSDGKEIEDPEFSLFCESTGLSPERSEVQSMLRFSCTKEGRAELDAALDMFALLDGNVKASMISFCLCLCAANGRITHRERKFLKRLLK